MTAVQQLARFVTEARCDRVSPGSQEALKKRVLDAVGCAFAARPGGRAGGHGISVDGRAVRPSTRGHKGNGDGRRGPPAGRFSAAVRDRLATFADRDAIVNLAGWTDLDSRYDEADSAGGKPAGG